MCKAKPGVILLRSKASLRVLSRSKALLAATLLSALSLSAQSPLFYATSSATQSDNTVQRASLSGAVNSLLFTAGGSAGNGVSRCTAVALDAGSEKAFLLDAGTNALWGINLDGTGLTLLKNQLTSAPLSLALDVFHRQIYYSTTSADQSGNTIQRLNYDGSSNVIIFSATGVAGNGVQRCTALAVDTLHSRLFIADAAGDAIWSINLDGSALTPVASGLAAAPMDLALDITNQLVYFTTSSAAQNLNTIQRVSYAGTGATTILVASNGVQRCTSLDLASSQNLLYFSDAGSNALWSVNGAGGAPALVESGLSAATVRILRLLPAANQLTVVNANDSGVGSLRDALLNISSPGVITFSADLFSNGPVVVALDTVGDTTRGPSALRVDNGVTILGPGGTNWLIITRSNSAPAMRLFYVSPPGELTLRNLCLSNGLAAGFPGGSGYQRGGSGGGAGGLGGAVFNEGILDLEDSTLAANQALGGDGGGTAEPWGGDGSGGGGGGLNGLGGEGGLATSGGTGGPPLGGAGGTGTGGGAPGGYGGGGGGGGSSTTSGSGSGPGADGGFGGGGGGGGAYNSVGFPGGVGGAGGNGGFAGGGGGGGGGTPDGAFGLGGFAGGNGAQANSGGNVGNGGGGGGGLGGAVFNSGGTLTVTNCTISANAAMGGTGGSIAGPAENGLGLGGGIFNRNGAVTVLNATFAYNRADQGGGAMYNLGDGTNVSGSVSLRNSILAQSLNGASDYAASAIHGGLTTDEGSYNLIQTNSGFQGSVVSTDDPRLGPLADNGGSTPTHMPLNMSPAIDAGDNTGVPPTDQRGYPRIVAGKGEGSPIVDLGAVEVGLFRLRVLPQTAASIQLSGFQLFLTGESNRLYVTEFSPDLTHWFPFATNEVLGAEIPVTDTQAGAAGARFYRAHAWP